jgi:hypothetical protein
MAGKQRNEDAEDQLRACKPVQQKPKDDQRNEEQRER